MEGYIHNATYNRRKKGAMRGKRLFHHSTICAMTCAVAMLGTVGLTTSQAMADQTDTPTETLDVAPSGLPSRTAPFDQTVAYFLWPYQWGQQTVNGQLGPLEAGEYGWTGPGVRPAEPNLKSLDNQIRLVKESGMEYVKTSYFISPLNVANYPCDQSKPGNCVPSTDLPDQVVQHILDAGLKPVIYFSQGNPDPKAVVNPNPNEVYKTVPSFTKQQVKDTISHAIQKFANKGVIWESFNEPESEEHWPGGNDLAQAKTQWIELDQFIGDTIQQYDPQAPYIWGNFSNAGKLNNYTEQMKAAHATATSGHGYWVSTPEGVGGPVVNGYDYMDSEFGCSSGNETSWSCGFSGVPKNSELQGIWLIRELLVKDIKGVSLASPYRMVGYDSFNINSDNDANDPGNVKTTAAYDLIKKTTLALKGYRYVDGTYQQVNGVYRAIYDNGGNMRKVVYWTDDKPTLSNMGATKKVQLQFDGQSAELTATTAPQVYEYKKDAPKQVLTNLTAWKDTDGNVIQAHGGSVLKDGDTFYWVGQGAPDNVPTDYEGSGGVFKNQWLYTTINMYKSKDLVNWNFANEVLSIDDGNAASYCDGNAEGLTSKVLDYTSDDPAFQKLVKEHPQYLQNKTLGCKIERPHILKNPKTGKYLIWAHWEGTVGYTSSQLVAFQSSTVDGKYDPVKWQDGQTHAQPKVMVDGKLTPTASRDLSAWMDPDTGAGYIISSTNKVRLYKLNSTFTGVDPNGSYELPGISSREAPSLFKERGHYYMITSAQDYWDPTQTEFATTTNLNNPQGWSKLTELQSRSEARSNWGNQDPNTRTYIGQPTYVLQYTDANGKPAVMLLADDWNPLRARTADVDTTKANYVMTPIQRKPMQQLSAPFMRTVAPMQAGSDPQRLQFSDVDNHTPHNIDIQWMADEDLATGWLENDGTYTFRGMSPVVRQDMAAFIRREAQRRNILDADTWVPSAEDYARFSDVNAKTPHAEDILWMAHAGLATGWREADGTTTFRGMDPIVRQDAAAFIQRLADKAGKAGGVTPKTDFTDVDANTPHVKEVQWLGGSGIAQGYSNNDGTWSFGGMTFVFRQDMAAFMHRLDDRMA